MEYELEQDDWRQDSRDRVREAIKNASRFQGTMQTRENLEALEAAKAELQSPAQGFRKDYVNGS